ncbi:MAG: NB-ARC domain-containing protein [Cyanobacteriota bacterium]|nr:NB-ARC domain-containing protein [Cyanobacteriota bacterium]
MPSTEEYADKFPKAGDNWDLERLYAELEAAKQEMSGIEPGNRRKKLTEIEKACLRGLLCGNSPDEIAQELHREASGLRVELSRGLYRYLEILTDRELNSIRRWTNIAKWLEAAGYNKPLQPPQRQDWGEAPDVSSFYGRTQELATLKTWVVRDRCRVVAILGMGGIGKSALSVKVAQELRDEFEFVIWRSLGNAPLSQDFLANLPPFRSNQQQEYLRENTESTFSGLIELLKEKRCLLILDGWQGILQGGKLAGNYLPGLESYGELLKQLAESPHQSCLLLTSREKPRQITAFEGPKLPVRALELSGLEVADAREIFREKNLSQEKHWDYLIKSYRGNPLALKIIAGTIQNFPFEGKVSEFLKYTTPFMGDIEYLIGEQFERLSKLEKEIMHWLAKRSQPVNYYNCREEISLQVSGEELGKALASLGRRSLIEKVKEGGETLCTLQPVLRKYVINNADRYEENTDR